MLKEGEDTVFITVLPEKEDQKLERWNGACQVFEENWSVIGSGTEVNFYFKVEGVININIPTTLKLLLPSPRSVGGRV